MLHCAYQSRIIVIYISFVLSFAEQKIKCVGYDECNGQTIECSQEAGNCYIECSGYQSCRDATIFCPFGYSCNINCQTSQKTDQSTNKLTCYGMIVNASQSTTLNVSATFATFENGQIYCPRVGDANGKPCRIYCTGDVLIDNTFIYAVNGFNDVNIESNSDCISDATMKCRHDFSAECQITNKAPFQCQENGIEDLTCDSATTTTATPRLTSTSTTTTIHTTKSGDASGLTSTQLVLVILLPLLLVACICIGPSMYMIKKLNKKQKKKELYRECRVVQYKNDSDDEKSYDNDDNNVIIENRKKVPAKYENIAHSESEEEHFVEGDQQEGVPIHVEGETNDGDEVARWLKMIGDAYYNDYYDIFIKHGYDEIKLIKSVTDQRLKDIGIAKIGHRENLLMEIQMLKDANITDS